MEDGTGNVERAHSIGKKILENHAGPLEQAGTTYSDLLTLRLDGPKSLSELAEQTANSVLRLTPLSREFLQEWRATHGARFRVYTKKLGCEKPKDSRSKATTQLKALSSLAQPAEKLPPSTATILPGLTTGEAAKLMQPGSMDSNSIKRFRARTSLIRKNHGDVSMRRKQNPTGNPFGTIKLKRASVFTAKPRVFVSLSEHILGRKRLKVMDATADGIAAPVATPEKAWDVRLRRLDDCGGGFLAFSQQCHLAVLESLDVLSSQKPEECLGFCL